LIRIARNDIILLVRLYESEEKRRETTTVGKRLIRNYIINSSAIKKGDTVKRFRNRILDMMILVGLILISLSCSKNPNREEEYSHAPPTEQPSSVAPSLDKFSPANSTQISLDQAENGVVIRLIGEGENGLWRLKDAQNDIEVKRMDDDMIDIKVSITIQEGDIVRVKKVNTQIKTAPGDIIVLAGTSGMGSNRTISLECPSN